MAALDSPPGRRLYRTSHNPDPVLIPFSSSPFYHSLMKIHGAVLSRIAGLIVAGALVAGGALAVRSEAAGSRSTAGAAIQAATAGEVAGGAPQSAGPRRGGPFKGVLDGLVADGTITAAQQTAIQRAFRDYWRTHHLTPGQGIPKDGRGPRIGGATKQVLDGLVANGTITLAQASTIQQRFQARFQQIRQGARAGLQAVRQAVASALGISIDQLKQQRQSGKSLSEIAAAHGKSDQQLQAAIVSAAQGQLAARVKEGAITQEQADRFLQRLQARLPKLLEAKKT